MDVSQLVHTPSIRSNPLILLPSAAFRRKLFDLFTWTANVHHPRVDFTHDHENQHESEDGTGTRSPRRAPQRFRPRGAGAEVLPLGEATLRFGAYFAAAFGADPFGLLPTGAAAGAADFPALARCAGGIAGYRAFLARSGGLIHASSTGCRRSFNSANTAFRIKELRSSPDSARAMSTARRSST